MYVQPVEFVEPVWDRLRKATQVLLQRKSGTMICCESHATEAYCTSCLYIRTFIDFGVLSIFGFTFVTISFECVKPKLWRLKDSPPGSEVSLNLLFAKAFDEGLLFTTSYAFICSALMNSATIVINEKWKHSIKLLSWILLVINNTNRIFCLKCYP